MDGYAMQPAVSTPGEVLVIGPESKINLIKNVIAGVNVSYKKEDIKSLFQWLLLTEKEKK